MLALGKLGKGHAGSLCTVLTTHESNGTGYKEKIYSLFWIYQVDKTLISTVNLNYKIDQI